MATEWFCRIMGEEWGPMSAMELMAVARRGRLSRDDQVKRGDSDTWVRAEVVRGLFNGPPLAKTATSDRLVAEVKHATPAKRSVRRLLATQYWVKADDKISGPYNCRALRSMAERGTLKPHHSVSKDRVRWARAAHVQGLTFRPAKPEVPTASVRSAIWLDASVEFSTSLSSNTETSESVGGVLVEAGP